jgi:YgiT-type zinc finger domain-containing protein
MTGSAEKKGFKRCPLCGGEMQDGITTIPFMMGERVTVIKNVPAEICFDCGEAYMKSSVVDKIESLLDQVEVLHSEMSVLQFEAA